MIAHVVLFTPREDMSPESRDRLLESVRAASSNIPGVRTFRIGRRIRHGLPGYEQVMRDDYEYAAIVEFEDVSALRAYLVHPLHATLGSRFMSSASRALAYDYEIAELEELLDHVAKL